MLSAARRLQLLTITATLAVAAGLVAVPAAWGTHDVAPARVAGEDRFDTAAEIARLQFPDGADTAVIAAGGRFPDALSAAGLSGAAEAPLLLVGRESIPETTASALRELGVEAVYLLGGTATISRDVEDELDGRYEVTRLAGEDRYATAAAVAGEVDRLADGFGEIAGLSTAVVAADSYPAATARAIADLGIEQVIIVGGRQAVSGHVERHLEEDTTAVLRLAGPTREATALAVADFAMVEFDYDGRLTVLARADEFADALAAGLHAGRNDAPILLTPGDRLAGPTHRWLHDLCPTVEVVRALGGPAAIDRATLDAATTHAAHCHAAEDQTGETYVVEPTMPVDTTPGASVDLTVRDRYDERPLQEPLDVTLFPCDTVDRAAGTFPDADGDGRADGIATTTENDATIESASEATAVQPRYAHDARFLHGALSWRLHSDASDCTVTVVFDDRDDDDQLSVDSDGNALEHYGARRVRWTTDSRSGRR